jgi:hypothetical protein
MKHCFKCGTTEANTWKGKYCAKCYSRIYRQQHPNYQREYDKKRNDGEDRRTYARERYRKNKKTIRARVKELRQLKPDIYRARDARGHQTPKTRFRYSQDRALKRNLTWTFTFEEYVLMIGQPCFYCANLLGAPVKQGVGLDRINNDIGYETNNVLPCCGVCNIMRNNFLTVEETKSVVAHILQLRGITLPSQVP